MAALRAANESGTGFGESYSLANPSIRAGEDIPQPSMFNGKLKAYQLKGMNWLANLYEQVSLVVLAVFACVYTSKCSDASVICFVIMS